MNISLKPWSISSLSIQSNQVRTCNGWIPPQSPNPESLNQSLRGIALVISPKLFVHVTIYCYTISPCTVRLNCSTASQSVTSIHFLRSFFLAGLFDLFAMTISISRASSGINGCLDTHHHQHTDVSHTLWVFENFKSIHRHSNWLEKFEKGCCKTWAHQWISGKHQVAGGPFFSSMTWEMLLPRKKNKLSSENQHECILAVSAATSAVVSLTSHLHMAFTCDHTCGSKLY